MPVIAEAVGVSHWATVIVKDVKRPKEREFQLLDLNWKGIYPKSIVVAIHWGPGS